MLFTWLETSAAAWLPVLLDATIKGTALLALAGLVTTAMRHTSAAPRHAVWFLAMAGLLLLPPLSVTLPGWQILPAWCDLKPQVAAAPAAGHVPFEASAPVRDAVPVSASSTAGGMEGESPSPTALPPRSPEPTGAEPATVPPASNGGSLRPFLAWLAGLWAAGTVAVLSLTLLGMLSVRQLEKKARRS